MSKYGILFMVGLIAALADDRAKKAEQPLNVSLVIFSGERDPAWTLSDDEAKQFARAFDSLGADDPKAQLKQGLGYRGLIVESFRGFDDVRVSNGVVQAWRDGKTVRWTDKDRGLERFLLKTSKPHVDAPIFKTAETAFEKG